MIKIEIKNRFTGSIIFEYSKENNSVSETVKEYIKQELEKGSRSADLRSADLSYANLSYADLRYADLRYANLSYANLRYADLRSANLSYADLSYANLSYASTDKRYIQVGCIGSSRRMTTYCFEDNKIWCGCFSGTLEDFEEKCKETHENNGQYLKEYLGFINYIKSLK